MLYTLIISFSMVSMVEMQALAAYYGVQHNAFGTAIFSGIATFGGIFGGAATGSAISSVGFSAGFFAVAAAIPVWGWIAIGVAVAAA